jgi:hypothetical protein
VRMRHGTSMLKIEQVYSYSGMTSLDVIRNTVPVPHYD